MFESSLKSTKEGSGGRRGAIIEWKNRKVRRTLLLIPCVLVVLSTTCIPQVESAGPYAQYGRRLRKLIHQADSLFYDQEFEGAKEIYRAILSRDSTCVHAHIGLGRCLKYTDSIEVAFKEFKIALDLDSLSPYASYCYGAAMWPGMIGIMEEDEMTLHREALHYVERSLMLDSLLAYPHLNLWAPYLCIGDVERSNFHLKELIRKDYFPPQLLDFGYNMLVSADRGGIIFTNGDNDTYPLLCLQQVYGIRTDVRVLNLSLLNTSWYARLMRDYYGVPITYPDEVLDTLVYVFDVNEGRYILASELLVRDISNTAARMENGPPVYFSSTISPSFRDRYLDNITQEGMLYRFSLDDAPELNLAKFEENMGRYRFTLMDPDYVWEADISPITRDVDEMLVIQYVLLHLYISKAWEQQGEMQKAEDYCRKGYYLSGGYNPEFTRIVLEAWYKIDPTDPELLKLAEKYIKAHGKPKDEQPGSIHGLPPPIDLNRNTGP